MRFHGKINKCVTLAFDSPVYSRKTRIDLDIRVVNRTHCTHLSIYIQYRASYASTKCIYEMRCIHITYYMYIYMYI